MRPRQAQREPEGRARCRRCHGRPPLRAEMPRLLPRPHHRSTTQHNAAKPQRPGKPAGDDSARLAPVPGRFLRRGEQAAQDVDLVGLQPGAGEQALQLGQQAPRLLGVVEAGVGHHLFEMV